MLRLEKLWVGGLLVYLLTVHVVICLGLAARLYVKFVSHFNAKGTICE